MTDRVERADPVIAEIKRLQPVTIKARMLDGSERAIAMPRVRNQWSRLSDTLDSLAWETLECLDKDGKLLGAPIEREHDGDGEWDDDEEGALTASTLRAILKDAQRVNLEIMRTTMKETRLIFESQTKSQSELVGVMVEGLRAVQESYSLAMRVQTAQLMAGPGEQQDSEVMNMMKMAMMMSMQGKGAPPSLQQKPQPVPARAVVPSKPAEGK